MQFLSSIASVLTMPTGHGFLCRTKALRGSKGSSAWGLTVGEVGVTTTSARQKLHYEIPLRGFSANTQDFYVRSVAGLAQFYHRWPDKFSDDEIKNQLGHLLRLKKLAVSSLIVAVSALRFFFGKVLHRPTEAIEKALPAMKKPVLRPASTACQSWSGFSGARDLIPSIALC